MYKAQDFQCDLPQVQDDRSVNLLTVVDEGTGLPFQIIVNRDQLLGSETLQDCFKRQIGLAERQTKGFKHTKFTAREDIPNATPVYCIESEFSQGGKKMYQLQAMVELAAPKLLVITLSSTTAISDGMRKTWNQLINTLKV